MTDSFRRSSSTVFLVGAVVGGAIQGPGRLTIEPGRLILKPSWPLRRLSGVMQVIHTESPVIVLKARLVPPWFSTSVSLHDDDTYAHVVVPPVASIQLARRDPGGRVRDAGDLDSVQALAPHARPAAELIEVEQRRPVRGLIL
jgi:hypothetical protein